MPGRMGGVQRTVKNVWVYQIDPARNLLYLKGQVVSSVPLNLMVCLADV
jgi:ribosomal protein L3